MTFLPAPVTGPPLCAPRSESPRLVRREPGSRRGGEGVRVVISFSLSHSPRGESPLACGRSRPALISQGRGRAVTVRALRRAEVAAMRQPGRHFTSHFVVISQLGIAPPGSQAAFKSFSPDDPGPGSESASVGSFQPGSASRPTLHRLAHGHASDLAAWHRSSQLNGAHCGAAGHRQAPDAPAS